MQRSTRDIHDAREVLVVRVLPFTQDEDSAARRIEAEEVEEDREELTFSGLTRTKTCIVSSDLVVFC